VASIDVKSTTICDMCEKTIETELIYEKGVKKVEVDLEKAIVHVEYDAKKTSPAAIRTAITKLGYQADDLPADEAAWKKLPACCKNEGCGKPAPAGNGQPQAN
jgi:copper chaperone CopZ